MSRCIPERKVTVRVTNEYYLPEMLYGSLAENRVPMPGELHCTEIIGPPIISKLRRRHYDQIVEDATDRLWALMGKGMHGALANDGRILHARKVLEEVITGFDKLPSEVLLCILQDLLKTLESTNQSGIESELRVKLSDKWTLLGTDDHYDDGKAKIMDWKITSVWNVLFGNHNWEQQLNVYAWMRRQLGYDVKSLEVWALLRDWQKSKAKYGHDPKYPKVPFARVILPLWSEQEQEDYIYSRLPLFDEENPEPCTNFLQAGKANERWERIPTYKVMKKGVKKAKVASWYVNGKKEDLLSVADATAAAKAKGITIGGDIYIQNFPGQCIRCQDYCSVKPFCPVWGEDENNRSGK
jgi:hypothetical protein